MEEKRVTKEKLLALTFSLVTLVGLLFVATQANPILTFEDEQLEAVIREKIDRPEGPIYETDMQNITTLDASASQITNLEGIQKLTRLTELNLEKNRVVDLSPLGELAMLTELNLKNNGLIDLEAANFDQITHLPLRELNLGLNHGNGQMLSDIQLVQEIKTLEELDLRDNQIQDVSPLASLEHLEELNLRNNGITQLEAVHFDAITHLPLERLSLRHNVNEKEERLTDIRSLAEIETLEELELRDNQIEELTPLRQLTGLEVLDLGENRFTSIEALADLDQLKELNLRNNAIESIEPLAQLTDLKYLNIHSNDQIASLAPLAGLVQLETLIMRHVPIRDELFIFEQLTQLQRLNALDTGIEELETDDLFAQLRAQGALQEEVRPAPLIHTVEPPRFSVAGGFYEEDLALELTTEVPKGTVYYTLDGSEPTVDAQPYIKGQTIPLKKEDTIHTATVRAKVITADQAMSETVTHTYFIADKIHERFTLPVVSLVTDQAHLFSQDTGIYTPANAIQRGSDWERPMHLEFFEEDGSLGFKQNGGMRIHGGATRTFPQKTLRLYAEYEYDDQTEFQHELFKGLTNKFDQPKTSFKRLLLRNSGNDWNKTMYRDAMMQSLIEPLGTMDTQAYRPSVVYINGDYWGIHNFRERYDEHYLAATYNLAPEDVTILESRGVVDVGEPGDEKHYQEMLQYIEETGLKNPEHYETVQTMMDTENFRDYLIAQTYFSNLDWPHGNIRYWRKNTSEFVEDAPDGHDGRWRWMLFDTDFGFGREPEQYAHNTIAWVLSEYDGETGEKTWPNFLIRALLKNEHFRQEFLMRYADLLNSTFQPEAVIARIDAMQKEIAPEMPHHINRWDIIPSMEEWERNVNVMRTFAAERPAYMRQYLMEAFGIEDTRTVTVDLTHTQEAGEIQINSLTLDASLPGYDPTKPWTGEYFQGMPVELTAKAAPGYAFSHWEGLNGKPANEQFTFYPETDVTIRPVFREK